MKYFTVLLKKFFLETSSIKITKHTKIIKNFKEIETTESVLNTFTTN
jgi:hypothetical protein